MLHTILAGGIGLFSGLSIGMFVGAIMLRRQTAVWQAIIANYENVVVPNYERAIKHYEIVIKNYESITPVREAFAGLDWEGVNADG